MDVDSAIHYIMGTPETKGQKTHGPPMVPQQPRDAQAPPQLHTPQGLPSASTDDDFADFKSYDSCPVSEVNKPVASSDFQSLAASSHDEQDKKKGMKQFPSQNQKVKNILKKTKKKNKKLINCVS